MLFTTLDEAAYAFATHNAHIIFWTIVTQFGDNITLLTVVLIAGLLWRRDTRAQLMLLIAGALSAITVLAIKHAIARPRPEGATLLTYSFPSGHTLGATAVYGTVALLLWRKGLRWQAGALLIIPLMVGISRIMLREHWASDAIAGWLIGAGIVAAVALLGNRLPAALTR